MPIPWTAEQRSAVADALRRFPWNSDRCAAAARAVLPVAKDVDHGAVGLKLTGAEGARFILSRSPRKRAFSHHVLVEAARHRVDALTGEDGHDAATYLEAYWQHADAIQVEEADVSAIDPGIQDEDGAP